jgi:enoyl-CoA hydratase
MRRNIAVGCHVVQRPDFIEGVRAVIVDKDNAPKWNPDTPEGVTDHMIDTIFAPLPPHRFNGSSEEWMAVTSTSYGFRLSLG